MVASPSMTSAIVSPNVPLIFARPLTLPLIRASKGR